MQEEMDKFQGNLGSFLSLDSTQIIQHGTDKYYEIIDKEELNKKLGKAILKNNLNLVIKLLERGADPNAEYRFGERPLHYACTHGCYKIVEFLLSKEADLKVTDDKGRTPLHNACLGDRGIVLHCHLNVVECIINHVNDFELLHELVTMQNNDRKTPLLIARDYRYDQLVDLLEPYQKKRPEQNKCYCCYIL